ncbi:DNA replication/repair protein RecF [Frigidibacter sp. ROC022]|uniref:DNA replication/repair protein RecF n=1 Tax=Frigidibacter sp. ROC022 TaxID=2971796 RepID=UPI00215A86A4|nr:DNA replication/repair protein RecF [Frigidibacter sp. ROC022]MCR8724388.1 DNA replication/repair protein RecF [Frigidibacter sp. ROC022]
MSRLALTSLTLSHFRSHALARLRFDGRPVAIWGPNGAGKTNILEALSLLSPGRGLRRAAADEMVRRPDGPGWMIAAMLETPSQTHELKTWAEPGAARQVSIDTKAAPQVALGRLLRMLWLVPSMDRLWIEGADGRRRFLDRIALSFEPAHAEASLAYDKAMRERNRLLKDMVTDAHWYLALEAKMAEAGAAITRNRTAALARIAAATEGAETAFPAARLALLSNDEHPETHEDLAPVLADNRRRDMAAGRTLIGPHRADLGAVWAAKDIPAAQCSTGEQKALLISLILANARALAEDTGAAPILLLDEVAAHLDASRRSALYDEICALGAQAFMTGTGAELFADLGDRAQRLEVVEQDGASAVRPD